MSEAINYFMTKELAGERFGSLGDVAIREIRRVTNHSLLIKTTDGATFSIPAPGYLTTRTFREPIMACLTRHYGAFARVPE